MSKDRSAPFSRKHRRYWIPVTGGMLLIGAVNLTVGYCSWPGTSLDRTPERIIPQLPVSEFARPDAAPAPDAASAGARDTARDGGPGDAAPGSSASGAAKAAAPSPATGSAAPPPSVPASR